ncbi:MAG: hypothetical protein ABSE46_20045 [Terracidiphilus sp.]
MGLAMGSHAWAQTPASEASKPGHPATPAPTAPSPLQSPPKTEAQKIGGGAAPSPWARKPPQPIKALEVGDLRPVKKDELSPRIVAARREAEQELELPLIRRIPVITWVDPASVKRGQALTGRELDAFSDVPGTFVFTPSAGNVPPQGICTLSTQFIPSDSKRYELTTATVVLEVE